ncbi:MAG: MFS transporter [Alphaproteobacteria bacterium]
MLRDLAYELAPDKRRALILILVAILISGVMVGLTIPLISLMLDARGLSPAVIGLNTAMLGIAALVALPLLPGLVARFSMRHILITSIMGAIGCFIAYVVVDSVWGWFVIRFIHGLVHTALFALAEFWINHILHDKIRGRVLGLYSALFAGGLMIGPLILLITGTDRPAPFLTGAALMALAAVPFITARIQMPRFENEAGTGGTMAFLWAAPTIMLTAMIFGLVETGLFQLMPIYALRAGNETQMIAWMMTTIGAGNMAFQLPIGWMLDRFDRRAVLVACTLAGVGGGASLPFLIAQPYLLYPSLFIWAGLLFGLYTIGLSMVGDRYQGAELLRANAAYVLLYSLGTLVGPILLGVAMDIWDPQGFPAAIIAVCLGFTLLILSRSAQKP